MKRYVLGVAAMALLASNAVAQQAGSHNPAIKNSHVTQVPASAHGRNSFTEDQARGRLAKAGYSQVSKLTKDANGVWRGTAMRGSRTVQVGLDYKGNVTTR